jgi:hypothetical protein
LGTSEAGIIKAAKARRASRATATTNVPFVFGKVLLLVGLAPAATTDIIASPLPLPPMHTAGRPFLGFAPPPYATGLPFSLAHADAHALLRMHLTRVRSPTQYHLEDCLRRGPMPPGCFASRVFSHAHLYYQWAMNYE